MCGGYTRVCVRCGMCGKVEQRPLIGGGVCARCGHANDPGARSCSECGAPLPKPPAPQVPTVPPFKASPRRWLFWPVSLVAAAVLLFNLASLFCPTLKQRLSATINGLVDGTEILLSVFAILVVFVALKGRNLMMVYKRRKKK